MLFGNAVAKVEAEAQQVLSVTTQLGAKEAAKTVLRMFEGQLAGRAVTGAWLDDIASGRRSHESEVQAPGDPTTAVLRMRFLPSALGTTLILDIPSYQIGSRYGLPQYASLSTAVGKRKKAIEKLKPTSVEVVGLMEYGED